MVTNIQLQLYVSVLRIKFFLEKYTSKLIIDITQVIADDKYG